MSTDPKKGEISTNPIVKGAATIRQGGVPHNENIKETIDEVEDVVNQEEKENPNLNVQGRKLAEDIKQLGEATKKLISEKNYDEIFQATTLETVQGAKELKQHGEMLSVEAEQMKYDSQKLLESVKSLSFGILKSGELRDLMGEFFDFLRALWRYSELPEKIETAREKFEEKLEETEVELRKREKKGEEETLVPCLEGLQMETPEIPRAEIPREYESLEKTRLETPITPQSTPEPVHKESLWRKSEVSDRELVERFKHIVVRFSSKPEFQEVISNLRTINWVMQRRAELHEQKFDERPFQDAKRLFRRFVGDQEFRRFRRNWWDLWEDLRHDDEMRSYFHDMYLFLERSFNRPEYVDSEEFTNDSLKLIERTRNFSTQEKYATRLVTLVKQGRGLLDSIKNDATLSEFQASLDQFFKDFGLSGPKGTPDLIKMTSGIDQLRMLLIPVLRKMLENIPLARIELYNPNYDMILDDIYLNGADILPEFFRMEFDNKLDADLRMQGGPTKNRARLWIEVSGMKPQFKHFSFAYRRKTFPALEDRGIANLLFKGDGMRIVSTWEVRSETGKQPVAMIRNCKCIIDSIDIHILEAEKHSIFDKMAATMMQGSVKRKLSGAIEELLYSNMGPINDQINEYLRERPVETLFLKATSVKSPISV